MRLRAAIDPTVGLDEQTGLPLLPRSHRDVRRLQSSSEATGDYSAYSPSSSSSSESSSGSSDAEYQNFVVAAYEGDCPSVTTLVNDCNASVDYLGLSFTMTMPCIIGPEDPEAEGSCDEPYSEFDTYLSSQTRFADMGIEDVESLSIDTSYVCLQSNELTTFNPEVIYPMYFQMLDLEDNSISSFNTSIMSYAISLNLMFNDFKNFTFSADSAEYLNISHNHLEDFTLTAGYSLSTVDISYNDLQTINLASEMTLLTLDASYNKLQEFSGSMGLYTLYSLYLQHNQLKTFNPGVALPVLEILNLSSNAFETLTLDTTYSVLSLVDVTNNSLKELTVKQAHALLARGNELLTFASDNYSASLMTLDLSSNRITDWSDFEPPSLWLRSLFASNNGATKLPRDLRAYTELSFIDFSFNDISTINATGWPPNLKRLDLRGNPIEIFDIGADDLVVFNNLESFYIDDFELTRCDSGNRTMVGDIYVCVFEEEVYETRLAAFTDNNNDGSIAYLLVSAAVALGFTIIATVIVVRFLGQRRKLKNMLAQQELEADPESWPEDIREDPNIMAMRIDLTELKIDKLVRKTNIAEIWRGRFKSSEVTIKRILEDKACEVASTRLFMDQIRLVDKLEHRCIVQHVGFTWNRLSDLSIVTELLPSETLEDLLNAAAGGGRKSCADQFSWYHCELKSLRSKLEIAIDVAEALVYLHSFSPPVIHRDIRARNVFVADNWGVKLGEVGLHNSLDHQVTDKSNSIPWMAPEVLREQTDNDDEAVSVDEKADVYSFGAFLVELDTCQRPFASGSSATRASMPRIVSGGGAVTNTQIVLGVSQGELRPSYSDHCPAEIAEIIDSCLELDPSARPMAMKLHYDLRQLLRAQTAPDSPV